MSGAVTLGSAVAVTSFLCGTAESLFRASGFFVPVTEILIIIRRFDETLIERVLPFSRACSGRIAVGIGVTSIVDVQVECCIKSLLFQISGTLNVPRLAADFVQCGEQHTGKDSNNGDYYEELHDGEPVKNS